MRTGLRRRVARRTKLLAWSVADRSDAAAEVIDRVLSVTKFRGGHGRWPALVAPVTYNDKLLHKRLRDRRAYLTRTADKVAVRDHVAGLVGGEVLSEFYDVVDDADDLNFERYPRAFVVKPSHLSGRVRVVPDKDHADLDEIRSAAREWTTTRWPLWNRWIPPRIIVEEFLGDPAVGPASDVKFLVMNGRVALVEVHLDRFGSSAVNHYLPDWTQLDIERPGHPRGPAAPQPANLDRMLELARELGRDTDLVRVDLYDLGDRVVFGELTHSPTGAARPFSRRSFDLWLGSQWQLPRRYRDLPS